MRARGLVTTAIVLTLGLAACGGSSSSSGKSAQTQNVVADKAAAEAAALKLADLPAGWTATPATKTPDAPGVDAQLATCLGVSVAELDKSGPADFKSDDLSDANNNTVSNSVGYAPSADQAKKEFAIFKDPKVPGCLGTALSNFLTYQIKHPTNPSDSIPDSVSFGTPTVAPLSVATVGDQTAAYRVTIPVTALGQTVNAYADFLIAVKGRVGVEMDFEAVGKPFPADQEQQYLQKVIGRLANT